MDVQRMMRQAILKPMAYAKGGRVPTIDEMRLALMDQKFPQMGINVTTDKSAGMRYADLIVDGKKQYETRDSDSLRPYVGKRVAIVRTGEGPAKAIGAVTVGEPMTANPKKFRSMQDGHLVPEGSRFDIKGGLKYLYPMIKPERFDEEQDVGHGIVSRRLVGKKSMKEGGAVDDDYRGEHRAPGPTSGKPMHDLKDVYPDDFYGPNGFRYYADTGAEYDRPSYVTARMAKGKPDQKVWIHRAIPTDVYKKALSTQAPLQQMIRPGDWVTISKQYAREHGEANLKGDYKIASKQVPASHLYTNGDSINEWGYHPTSRMDKE